MVKGLVDSMIKKPGEDLLEKLGLGGELRGPAAAMIDAVAADRDASTRAEELADQMRGRIGHFFGQTTLLTEDDRGRFKGVEGAVPLMALLLSARQVKEFWHAHGYPSEVIAGTFADVGRQVRKTMAVTGRFGLGQADWLEMIWRGGFAQLGRLQFEIKRSDLGEGQDAAPGPDVAQGPDARGRGRLVLSTHIAPIGALAPDAVDDSLGRARGFFTGHFRALAREEGAFERAMCESWLLDTDLMGRMPGSNMDLFARRWTVWSRPVSDGSGMFFGFNRPHSDGNRVAEVIDELPYDTSLHRAMIDLWRAGGHVHNCSGWLELPAS